MANIHSDNKMIFKIDREKPWFSWILIVFLFCTAWPLGLALLLCQLLIRPTGGQSLLRITVPEDLDYTQMFDDVFARYTKDCETVSVKTTNMGSLFRLTYRITMKDTAEEKAFIDALRCRNGNLEVSISQEEANAYAL